MTNHQSTPATTVVSATADEMNEDDAYAVWFMEQWDSMTLWQKIQACAVRNPFADKARRARWDLDRARTRAAVAEATAAALAAENEALRAASQPPQDRPES